MTWIIGTIVSLAMIAGTICGLAILRAAALGDFNSADFDERQAERDEIFCTPDPAPAPKRFLDEGVHYCTCCGTYWAHGIKTTWTVLPPEYFCESSKLCDPCCHSIAGQEVARREA